MGRNESVAERAGRTREHACVSFLSVLPPSASTNHYTHFIPSYTFVNVFLSPHPVL